MKIALLAVPFLSPQYPSLGLTQIKGRLNKVFGGDVEVRLVYLNHDFFHYFGAELYGMISGSGFAPLMNEWVFRSEAFDPIESNHEEYFRRFFPGLATDSPQVTYLREKSANLGAFIRQVAAAHRLDTYDVIGINATFEIVPALALCRHLKQIRQTIITVMGGAALSEDAAEMLARHYPYLDYVCSGLGLVAFPQLIRGLIDNDETARESIDGMLSAGNAGKVGHIAEELDINEDMPLDYDDFFQRFQRSRPDRQMEPVILMETSRGCHWCSCTFCGLNKDRMKYRVKRPKIAIEEINRNFEKYGCNIEMVDNVMPRSYIKHVLPYLRVPPGKMLLYEVTGDYKEEEVKALNRARVKMIQPGIESLSTPVLELMNKGTTAFQCLTMLKNCVKYGVLPGWNLLIGFPHMTAGMYEGLLSIMAQVFHLFPPGTLNPVRIDRYSTYWQNSEKYNLVLAPFTAYEYIYPYDHDVLSKIAYHFEDRNYSSERYYLLSEYYPRLQERLDQWKRRWQTKNVDHFPRLTFRRGDDGTYIFDSRREEVKEYKISSLQAKVLKILEAPLTKDGIITGCPGETGERIDDVLGELDGNGLLCEENGRYLSLVIPEYKEDEIKFIVETCNYQL